MVNRYYMITYQLDSGWHYFHALFAWREEAEQYIKGAEGYHVSIWETYNNRR